jgi:hypothetical protein
MRMVPTVRLNIVCSKISFISVALKSVIVGQSSVKDLSGGTPLNWSPGSLILRGMTSPNQFVEICKTECYIYLWGTR